MLYKKINLKAHTALIRTDFSNQRAWEKLVDTVQQGDCYNKMQIDFIDDPEFERLNDAFNILDHIHYQEVENEQAKTYAFLQHDEAHVKCVNIYNADYFTVTASDVVIVDENLGKNNSAFADFLKSMNAQKLVEMPLPITQLTPLPKSQPFPYFGQGIAKSAKWAILFILFQNEVDARIKSSIPVLLRKEIAIDGNLLTLKSSEFIAPKIEARYGKDRNADMFLQEADKMYHLPSCFEVSQKVNQLFENEIEQWLLLTHQKTPIIAVARGVSGWLGQVQQGEWQQGFEDWEVVSKKLLKQEELKENHFHFMESSVSMMKMNSKREKIPQQLVDRLLPQTRAHCDIDNGKIDSQTLSAQNTTYHEFYFQALLSRLKQNEEDSAQKLVGSYQKVEHLTKSLDEEMRHALSDVIGNAASQIKNPGKS